MIGSSRVIHDIFRETYCILNDLHIVGIGGYKNYILHNDISITINQWKTNNGRMVPLDPTAILQP